MSTFHKSRQPTAQAGDLVQLITEKQRHFIFTLPQGQLSNPTTGSSTMMT